MARNTHMHMFKSIQKLSKSQQGQVFTNECSQDDSNQGKNIAFCY